MLRLNKELADNGWLREWPSPNRSAVLIRSAARSFRTSIQSLLQRVVHRRAVGTETGAGTEKTIEQALDEYRKTLQRTFCNPDLVNDVVMDVREWFNGGWVITTNGT